LINSLLEALFSPPNVKNISAANVARERALIKWRAARKGGSMGVRKWS
jgi:hypothetical protein